MVEQTDETEHTPVQKLGPRSRLRVYVLLAITVAGLFVCSLLLVPFLPALTWAMALAILFAPAHRWVEARVRWKVTKRSAPFTRPSLVLQGDRAACGFGNEPAAQVLGQWID